jgi:acetylornithine deacetylase
VRRRSELVSLPQELVQLPSVTGQEEQVQHLVASKMREMGLSVTSWEPTPAELAPDVEAVGEPDGNGYAGRPNVVGTLAGAGGGRSLILNAHVDVVDPGDPDRWTHPPFAAEIADGRIYGRGACDMKGGLATHLVALQALHDAGLAPLGDVIVESVISEEDGGAGTASTLRRGYVADAAIITEPTRLAAVVAQGGSLVFRLKLVGKSAHACARDEGVSTIEVFAYIHAALLEFEARHNAMISHPLYEPFTNKAPLNIGNVRAGTWPSSVPDWLIAEGRVGLVPGENVASFRQEFLDEIQRIAAGHPWLRDHPPVVEWFSGQFAPAEIAPDHPLVATLAAAHARATGQPISIEGATYGADMRHFLDIGGMPCVMYGAGDVRVAHYTDEHVAIDDLMTATQTIALTVASWCGVTALS